MHSQFLTADEPATYNPLANEPARNSTLSKLLLNSWSAEYALNITPVISDDNYLRDALNWTFPQSYYAVLFSARAVLLCNGNPDANESRITPAMTALSSLGLYERDFNVLEPNPLVYLDQYRISSSNPATIQSPYGETIQELHSDLCGFVDRSQMAHERYIFDCIGKVAYLKLIATLPSYLRDAGFLSDRTQLLIGFGHA